VATLAAIAVTPFFVHNKMTDSPAYQRMLSQSHQTLGPAAWPFGWIMRAEPAVYPVGAKVRDGITVADRAAKTELTRLRRCTSGGHIKQCASGSRNSRKALF